MSSSLVLQSLFLRSLLRQPVERTPVWMMRQAGRYLPEYRAVRARAGSFLSLCQHPEWACEVTLQPLERFALDAAILFSDILTIPDAMGLGLSFQEGEGPRFERSITDRHAIEALPPIVVKQALSYVFEAVALIRKRMPAHLPLIGFAGSPWTLACYMIEGQSSPTFKRALCLMYNDPEAMHVLLQQLTTTVTAYLSEQIIAGVNAVMLFDTWGGLLSTPKYLTFSLQYMKQIVQNLKEMHPTIPVIVFTKGGTPWLSAIAETGCHMIGVDWHCDLAAARAMVGDRVALQGNLDPTVLLTSPATIRSEVQQVLQAYGKGTGHVFNLGHGITPDVPISHVSALIEAVHTLSPAYHVNMNAGEDN